MLPHRRARWSFVAFGGVLSLLPLSALASACRKGPTMRKEGCDALLENAHAAMQTLDVTYNRPQTCVDDKDCVELGRPSCISMCAGMAFTAKDVAIVRRRVAESEERECKPWSGADCATISPRPIASCASYRPRCQDTKCAMVTP